MMEDVLVFVAVGFAAQMVDGALGMAYGVTASTVLLGLGVAPATASASVHVAEVVTCGVSGLAHWRCGNIDRGLFVRLAPAGMVGGAVGALVLAHVPAETILPVVSAYLLAMGVVILVKALRPRRPRPPRLDWVPALGAGGGFLDAVGGGGWGPVVASTLLGNGTAPRFAIGSVNAAEFLVATTVAVTFLGTIGIALWPVITGLVVGGALAAPLAAYAVGRVPDRPLMILVAVVVMLLSLRNLADALG